jgi:hypothetical protein
MVAGPGAAAVVMEPTLIGTAAPKCPAGTDLSRQGLRERYRGTQAIQPADGTIPGLARLTDAGRSPRPLAHRWSALVPPKGTRAAPPREVPFSMADSSQPPCRAAAKIEIC